MRVDFIDLQRHFIEYEDEYIEAARRVLKSGKYILGDEGELFEEEFALLTKGQSCVGVNSGLDAIKLGLIALGIESGDEVILPANTYIATALAISLNGAKPIFVDVDEFYNIDINKIPAAISKRTKCIIAVHLYGQAANMGVVCNIAREYNLKILEDCAQAHGTKYLGKPVGTIGDIGCFSFFPTKNLGAFGDAGAIVTSSRDVEKKVRALRNYGSITKYENLYQGYNSRLDEIQAAFLRVKMKNLKKFIEERQSIADYYNRNIENANIILPEVAQYTNHSYHLYVIRTQEREKLKDYLSNRDINTQVHYPIPPHLSACYKDLGYKRGDFPITEEYSNSILSLPLYHGMSEEEMGCVVEAINQYK
jgi:dTDP-4-amino-4,6-dideoxygalactose transaminase